MRRRRRYREDPTEDVAKAIGALIMLAVLFAIVQPQMFAALIRVGLVVIVLGLFTAAAVFFFKFSRAQRENDATRSSSIMDFQTLSAPCLAPRSPPVASIAPPTTSPERITQEELADIDWFQFEKVMAALFESRGDLVERRGGANPDGGIDLAIDEADERVAVQCKHWKACKVGVRHVREFFGGMKAEGFNRGIFIASSDCTNEAWEFASQHDITILNAFDIEQMLAGVDANTLADIRLIMEDPTKHCPKCGAPMVLRVAERGPHPGSQFWGCSTFPCCNGKMRLAD